jgi:gliding motility-associated-like protein
MLKTKVLYKLLITGLLFTSVFSATAQFVIHAGINDTVCSGDSAQLGNIHPVATGGTAPYTFSWAPAAGISNPNDSSPMVLVHANTTFTLTVLDGSGNRQLDSMRVIINAVVNAKAGNDTTVCTYLDSAQVGLPTNPPSYLYSWSPTTGLDCSTCPLTYAKPSTNTTYTLTVTNGACQNISQVAITVIPPPVVSTVSPVTIQEGQSVLLNVTGLSNSFQWQPNTTLTNFNSATPEASPTTTTTYTVFGKAADGCYGIDSVTVNVEADSNLFIYNTFTPNGDGINDTWFIGNIGLFPNNEVAIFNRYGAQMYHANAYDNLKTVWDGTILGTPVPDATYYYVIYTGTGKTYRGSVTIIRNGQ